MSGYSQKKAQEAAVLAYWAVLDASDSCEEAAQDIGMQFWDAVSSLIESKYPKLKEYQHRVASDRALALVP